MSKTRRNTSPLPGLILFFALAGSVAVLHFTGKLQPLIDKVLKAAKNSRTSPVAVSKELTAESTPNTPASEEPNHNSYAPDPETPIVPDENNLAAMYRKKFKPPQPGSAITLVMRNQSKRTGILQSIDDQSVSISSGNAQITLSRDQLAPAGLAICYEDDYVKYMVALHKNRQQQAKARKEIDEKLIIEYRKFMASKGKAPQNISSSTDIKKSLNDIDFKDWMEKNGATEMLKARQQRIKEYEAERIAAGREY
ncbi:MAG: hypothetical protein JXN60_00755 [Lentisphaerae bacterium]|nr:hypothetical protein [Lentisphaerota bacterium]